MIYQHFKLLTPLILIIIGLILVVVQMNHQLIISNKESIAKVSSEQASKTIQGSLQTANQELKFIATLPDLESYLLENSALAQTTIALTFRNLIVSNPDFYQVRLLDLEGNERIKVVFDNSQTRILPESKLQNKFKRDYFQKSLRLRSDQIYQSQLDLNKEFGEIERPFKPTVRLIAPITIQNKIEGFIAINLNVSSLFHKLKSIEISNQTNIMVANQSGYFFNHDQPEFNWGFMFENTQNTLRSLNPDLWQSIHEKTKTNIFQSDDGHYYSAMMICSYKSCPNNPTNAIFIDNHAADLPWIVIAQTEAISWNNSDWLKSQWTFIMGALFLLTFLLAFRVSSKISHSIRELSSKTSEVNTINRKLYNVIEAIPDGVIILGSDKKIETVNHAITNILGMSDVDLIGEPIEVFMQGRFKEKHYAYTDSFFANPRKVEITREHPYVYEHPNGAKRFLQAVISPMEHDGQTLAIVLVKDVTNALKQEEHIRQSQKLDALGQLTGGVAHDFNNLLAIMLGNLELLELQTSGDIKLNERIAKITKAINTASDLTQKLLAVSRNKALSTEVIDVSDFMQDTLNMLKRTIKDGIEIHYSQQDHLEKIEIDANELTNAMINLAINARDAMPDGGSLSISVESTYLSKEYISTINENINPGNYILISFEDTGTGIPKSLIDKVIEPFFTTKPKGKGTGLGLAMIYGFIKQSHGHMRIYSEEGQGSNIRLYLPTLENEEAQTDKASTPVFTPGNWSSLNALVIDDEEDLAEVAATYLEMSGMSVDVCHNAVSGWQAIENKSYDLVFTDIVMPGEFDGLGLYQKIQEHQLACKVVLASGFSEKMVSKKYQLGNDCAFIKKPYKRDEMLKVIDSLLGENHE
jgi:PAS domain S-box-containing protein